MTDVGVKYDRFLGRSVMGAFVVVRSSFVVATHAHFPQSFRRFEYRVCQVGEGRAGGPGFALSHCNDGASACLKKVENRLHCQARASAKRAWPYLGVVGGAGLEPATFWV